MKSEIKILHLKQNEERPQGFTGSLVYELYTAFLKDGLYHNEDGPAVIYKDTLNYSFYLKVNYLSFEKWFEQLTEEKKIQALFNINEWRK